MIDVKQATKRAIEYFSDLFPNGYQNVRLEEIEISDDHRYWYVTLGFDVPPAPGSSALAQALGAKSERAYKRFTIDRETGDVVSMKILKI
jgi:hypothetical protein